MRFVFLAIWLSNLPLQAQKIAYVDWGQLEDVQKVEKRKVLVNIYTDWCNWCRQMDNNFNHPSVIAALDKKYYVVRLNAETRQELTYKGKVYRFLGQGHRGYNELALLLNGGGTMTFPCVVFMDEQMVVLQSIRGYYEPEVLASMIAYFGSNANRQMSWDKWQDSHDYDAHPEDMKDRSRPVQAPEESNTRPNQTTKGRIKNSGDSRSEPLKGAALRQQLQSPRAYESGQLQGRQLPAGYQAPSSSKSGRQSAP